jgi:hypothetical protein
MKLSSVLLLIAISVAPAHWLPAAAQTLPARGESGSAVQATDPNAQKARALLDHMIQTLGGNAYLTIQDMEQDGRVYGFYHGESEGTGVLFWRFWRWPDKERVELTKQRDWVVIYNGDKGYDRTFRGTTSVDAKELDDYVRRRHYSLAEVLRVWLKDPATIVFYGGPAFAEQKAAEKITVLNPQNESVDIFIDSISHLPVKESFTWRDPETRDRYEESEGWDAYRNVQGIMTPFRTTRYKEGEMVSQRFINNVKYNQNLPDSMFEAQVTWNPNELPPKKK